jgi:hypothetical protein
MLAAGGGAIVIVPGGGPFADQAGGVQMRRRFDDAMARPPSIAGRARRANIAT